MRDYSNMPKLQWKDDAATMAKIKLQVKREEPVILVMPSGFDFSLDAAACKCREEHGMLTYCEANRTLSVLAEQNGAPVLKEIGPVVHDAGLTVDIDSTEGYLVIHG